MQFPLKAWLTSRLTGSRFEPRAALTAVRVVDEDLCGAAGDGAADGGGGVSGHQHPGPAVLGTAGGRLVVFDGPADPLMSTEM